MPKTFIRVPESIRSDRDRMAEDTDSCVICGAPRCYPLCPECEAEDAVAFAEDMRNGNPWEDHELPLPTCRKSRRFYPYAF